MLSTIASVYSLLLAIGILLVGSGLLGTLVGLRAGIEGFSNTVTGLIMSAFFVGYIIGAYLCPRLLREVGYIRAFSVLAAVAAVTMIAHGLIIDPFVWWGLRTITGICVVGLYMIVESWMNSLIKTHPKRGRIFSVYMMTTLVALASGQYLLLVYGVTELASFALGAIFFIISLIPVAVTRLPQPAEVAAPKMQIVQLFKQTPLGTIGALSSGLVSGAFWGMGAVYANGLGFDSTGVAIFLSSVILGGVLLQYPIGHRSDLHDRRMVMTIVAFIASAIASLTYFLSPENEVVFFTLVLLYGGFSFSIYSLSVAHTQDLVDIEQVTDATRTLLLFSGLGAAIGPVIAGIMMQLAGNSMLMIFFAMVLGLLGMYAAYRMTVAEPIPVNEQEAFMVMARTSPEVVELDPRIETGENNK